MFNLTLMLRNADDLLIDLRECTPHLPAALPIHSFNRLYSFIYVGSDRVDLLKFCRQLVRRGRNFFLLAAERLQACFLRRELIRGLTHLS